ncbi:MAG: ribonuclease, partial [Alphaproteobacteria bacterium]|nr:ribonuclease [Alphaproteobacteria bacterium]
MANKMLIDATHPEETRVVVVRGNRVEEFDFESANRKQLRGNIYLAKVTRVEPSLQAAFVDYGGNRHGFLAFSEIHPDYYQIPVADRQALIDEEERAHRDAEAEADRRAGGGGARRHRPHQRSAERGGRDVVQSEPIASDAPGSDAPGSDTSGQSGHPGDMETAGDAERHADPMGQAGEGESEHRASETADAGAYEATEHQSDETHDHHPDDAPAAPGSAENGGDHDHPEGDHH